MAFKNAHALNFSGVNSNVNFGTNILLLGNILTLEAWIYVTGDNSTYRSIVANRVGTSATTNYEIGTNINSGSLYFFNGTIYDSTVPVPKNEWVHVAITNNAGTLTFYINGVNVKVLTGVGAGSNSASCSFVFGNVGGSQPYIGSLDEVRIWNVARTESEIKAYMKRKPLGNESGLIGYFDLEEGTGTSTKNKVLGSSLVGTLGTGTTWVAGSIDLTQYDKILLSSNNGEIISFGKKEYGSNVIPAMTSNTTPSGVASSSSKSSSSYEAWTAFDGKPASGAFLTATGQTTGWLAYEFPVEKRINKYAITHFQGITSSYDMKSWTFDGWDGISWITLDTRINNIPQTTRTEYEFENEVFYKKYRINVTLNNGGDKVGCNALEMMEITENEYLISMTTLSEENFIDYGLDSMLSIDAQSYFTKKKNIESESITFGSGRTYEHDIDLSKRKTNKISFQ